MPFINGQYVPGEGAKPVGTVDGSGSPGGAFVPSHGIPWDLQNNRPMQPGQQPQSSGGYSDLEELPNEPEKKEGILMRMAKAMVKPAARVVQTARSFVNDAGSLGAYGIAKIAGKDDVAKSILNDNAKFNEKLNQSEFRPLRTEEGFGTFAKDVVGTGLELGAYMVPGMKITQIGRTALSGAILPAVASGAATGFAGGALAGAGSNLTSDKKFSVASLATDTIVGGVVGSVTGALLSGVTAGASKAINAVKDAGVRNEAANAAKQALAGKIEGLPTPGAPEVPGMAPGAPEVPGMAPTAPGVPQPKVRPSSAAQSEAASKIDDALRAGVDVKAQDFIANSSADDIAAYKQMFSMAEKGSSDMRAAATGRPVEYVGKSILEKVNHIRQVRSEVGAKLGETVKNFPKKPLDFTEAKQFLVDSLDEAGIVIDDVGKLDFADSRIQDAGTQKLFQKTYSDLAAGKMTPKKADLMRKTLFDALELGKDQKAMTDYSTKVLEELRGELAKPLDKIDDSYRALRTNYADLSKTMSGFYDLMGKKFTDSADDIVAMRAGEVANRVLGNASAKPLEVLQAIDDVAMQTGLKTGGSSIDKVIFSDFLEQLFGAPNRGLAGQVSRGVTQAAETLATQGKAGLIPQAIRWATGQSPDAQRKAIKAILDAIK